MDAIRFQLDQVSSGSGPRSGYLQTPHGDVRTPALVALARRGVVPALSPTELHVCGVQITAVNAIDLMLRPGLETIHRLGGLRRFTGWDGPIVAESGIHDVLHLAEASADRPSRRTQRAPGQPARVIKLDQEAISFTSYVDGSTHRVSPETSLEMQEALDVDLLSTFASADSPPGHRASGPSVEPWAAWIERSVGTRPARGGLLAVVEPSRVAQEQASVDRVAALPLDGFMLDLTESQPGAPILARLPPRALRYAQGLRSLDDVRSALVLGCDLLACEFPVWDARQGRVYASQETLDLWDTRLAEAFEPIDRGCVCLACRQFTRAYLHHLFEAEELLGYHLATLHNLTWVARLIQGPSSPT